MKRIDQYKAQKCSEIGPKCLIHSVLTVNIGITLVQIPYWWNKKRSSLEATLHQVRPELVPGNPTADPVPSTPPSEFKVRKSKVVSNIQNQLMLAVDWNSREDPKGWYENGLKYL